MKIKKTSLLSLVLTLPLVIVVLLDLKSFYIWSQILDPWSRMETPAALIAALNPHALRYTLVYPILILSELSGIDYNIIFSGTVIFLLYQTGRYIFKTAVIIDSRFSSSKFVIIIIYVILTALFLLMNGRISFAFMGYTLLLYSSVQVVYTDSFKLSGLPLMILGVVMCSVSSGVIVSAIATLAATFILELITILKKRKLKWSILYFFFVFLFVFFSIYDFVLIGISKNLLFYGGGYSGFLAMFDHGFGRVLIPLLSLFNVYSLISTIVIVFVILILAISKMPDPFLLGTILITITGGAFGMSTLSISIIPLLVYFLCRYSANATHTKRYKKQNSETS